MSMEQDFSRSHRAESKQAESGPKRRAFNAIKSLLIGAAIFHAATDTESPPDSSGTPTEQVERGGSRLNVFGAELGLTAGIRGMDTLGNAYVNPLRIIAPYQAEVSWESDVDQTVTVRVPYRYSRQFNTAEATSAEERAETARLIEDQMRQEFGERLLSLDPTTSSENTYRYEHQGESPDVGHLRITDIAITGTASPEGPEGRGSATIAPDAIDQENISLSKQRATDMDPVVKRALKNIGINPETAATNVTGEELQFSDDELARLAAEATRAGITDTADEGEAAYLLIKAYNDGEISNAETQRVLDEVVGSKRMVNVEVAYEGDQRTTLAIPIPLTLLLFYFPYRYLKRERKEHGKKEKVPEDIVRERFAPVHEEDTMNGVPAEEWLGQRIVERVREDDPRFVEKYENVLRTETPALRNRPEVFKRLLIDEFNPYLGTKKDDIGYMDIIMGKLWNDRAGQDPAWLHRKLTLEVLDRWQDNDQTVRRRLARQERSQQQLEDGEQRTVPNEPDIELTEKEYRYWQDAQKVMWAQETASLLMHFHGTYRGAMSTSKPERAVYQELSRMLREIKEDPFLPPARQEEHIRKVQQARERIRKPYKHRKPEKL